MLKVVYRCERVYAYTGWATGIRTKIDGRNQVYFRRKNILLILYYV